MKKWTMKIFAVLIPCIILFTTISIMPIAEEKPKRVLTVAFPQAEGINEIYEDGRLGGCTYDWLMEIAKYTGWEYNFITDAPPEVLVPDMTEGKYDIMGGMYYLESFDENFCYPDYIMGTNKSLLIYRKDNDNIKNFDLTTLNNKTIGVLERATAKTEQLRNFLLLNNLNCTLVYYEDSDEYEACLKNRKVDMMLGSDVYMTDEYNVAAQFDAQPYYLVTRKSDPELCEELNKAMLEIYSANPNFAKELYDKYFPGTYINSISFSKDDLRFIEKSDPIRVSVVSDCYPVHYEKEKTHCGITPDIFALISERTGLDFTYVHASSYQESLDLVKSGQADVVGCFLDDAYAAQDLDLILTKQYAELDEVILRNKQSAFPDEGLILARPEGRAITNVSPSGGVLTFKTYAECLDAVNSGRADYTRLPSSFVEDLYLKDYYGNLILVAADNNDAALSIALPKSLNVPLYSILNKAVNSLSPKEIDGLLARNLVSAGETNISLKSLFYTNPVAIISVFFCFLILIMVIVLLLMHFKTKNRMMQLRLEKSEETGRAKSDFLSRMSHEIRTPMNAIIGLTNLTRMSDEATPALQKNLEKIDASARFLLSLVNDILDMSKIENDKMKIECTPFHLKSLAEKLENMFGLQTQQKGVTLTTQCTLEQEQLIGDEMRIQQVLTNLLSNACKFTDSGGTILLDICQTNCAGDIVTVRFSVKDNGIGIPPADLERIFDSFEQVAQTRRNAQGTGLGLTISSNLVKLMGSQLCVQSQPGKGSEFHFELQMPAFYGELQEAAAPHKDNVPFSFKGMRLLLAEDNDLNAEIATALLEMQEVTVKRVENGQQAVEQFCNNPAGYFDFILMDIQMPVKDGFTATTEIRAFSREDAAQIPIIAMTANTFQEDRESASAAGMSGFVPKPFDVSQLYEALENALSSKAADQNK